MADENAERDDRHEQIRRDHGDDYEEREDEGEQGHVPKPADDPRKEDIPPLTEPGAEQ